MLTTTVLVLLLSQLATIQGQPDYETIPLRFDLAIDRLRQYQYISLDNVTDLLPLNEIPTLLTYIDEVTQCDRDFQLLLEDTVKRQLWAIKVIDAWGKPLPSGLLKGNIYWTGNYDECVQNFYLPQNKSFLQQPMDTQHCTLLPESSPASQMSKAGIILGMCVPSSCSRSGVVKILRDVLKHSNVTEDHLLCSNEQRNLSRGAIVTCLVLSFLGLIVLIGTVTDVINNIQFNSMKSGVININGYTNMTDSIETERKSMTLLRDTHFSSQALLETKSKLAFMAEFSALRTLRRVFNIETKTNNEGSLPFLNGVRVFALFWIIIGHSLVFSLSFSSNPLDLLAWTHNLSFQLIINAVYSVDTFFVISGFLTTILFVRQVNKKGKLSVRLMILYYIHRYIRLTPTFLLVILISINLTPYFGHGPMYPIHQGFETAGCRNRTWWTSILYVGNLVQSDDMCLPISWYLYNDMQFYWVAPLALIPFVIRRKPIGFIVVTFMIFLGIGSILGIILHYPDLSLNAIEAFAPQSGPSFFKYVYIKPWCRISAYAVGILTGFIVTNTGRTFRVNIYLKYIGTILAILIGLICLFILYPDYLHVPGLSRTSLIIFQTLSRTGWAISIGWLIFLCSTNQGGLVNKILSWPVWTPLARLNYSAYLIHTIIIDIIVLNQTMPSYFQHHIVVNTFVTHIFFSYVAAIVVYIFFETPFFIFEKKLFKRD
ncbi:unnamed protein product [Rotaria socialis]|uniref:Nose resistant-to-fluoxetine protein N-terminal domain-containing protein n=2 Tax=Rotaria socialis TaxID=392032 RepID=A0A817Q5K9_9BILA|nr:unnamed protein product [Rotaria socialis]CAF3328359.1 unnamed protein product [Rotaria socialis]CAF3351515.1 unnamed protein product [Rotaria socialis]CAF3646121.1 unnamed protein product [Rotaria socialis]CAF4343916.1 unnamed protein product [Rotaria socialis]